MKTILVNNKILTKNNFKKSGIYQINCNDCDCIYIGQTARNFNIRFDEHMRCFKNNRINSNVAQHFLDNEHTCNKDNLSILHCERERPRLTFLEAIYNGYNLMNELDLCPSLILDCLISVFPRIP